jgi:hypothetical protein
VTEKNCKVCGQPIPLERLEALPETETCVGCSDEKKKMGFMDYSHKTAPEFVEIDPNMEDSDEDIRRAARYNNRDY